MKTKNLYAMAGACIPAAFILLLHSCDTASSKREQKSQSITLVDVPTARTTGGSRPYEFRSPENRNSYSYTPGTSADGNAKLETTDDNSATYSITVNDNIDSRGSEYNTENYSVIQENEFLRPSAAPLSTFSVDVDVASYGIIRKKLEAGEAVPKDAVRIEEMVNYFTYNYPEPKREKPFSVNTELSFCPWNTAHKLLRIGIHGKKVETQNLPAANLVFLIDVSGSMDQPDKLPLVKNSLRMLVNQLGEKDRVAMVTYAGTSGLALPSTSCRHKERIIRAIEDLGAGGSTNGAEGIFLAYQVAKQNMLLDGNNRVILCTDGDFNVGVTGDGDLTRLIEKKRGEGIFLSVLGFGMGNYKDTKMELLADKGNGNYAYIDNVFEAQKNLVSQMGGTLLCIAKDVKIQVEFNPEKVKGYRLIGYENRIMNAQDFNDDTKDAGEIGAGTNVTAYYEITTEENDGSLTQPKTDVLKYQKTSQTLNSGDLLTVKLRYKEPKEDRSRLIEMPVADKPLLFASASEDFRFGASVAALGMVLRDSKFKGSATAEKAIEWAKSSTGADSEGYRAEFIRLAGMAKNTL